MDGFIKRAYLTLLHPFIIADPTPVVSLISLLAIWWGVLLLVGGSQEIRWLGGDELGVLFLRHVPLFGWAAIFVLIGFGLALARLLRFLFWERMLILLSSMVWAFTAASLFKVAPLSFATGTYMLITIFSAWAYWRVRYE